MSVSPFPRLCSQPPSTPVSGGFTHGWKREKKKKEVCLLWSLMEKKGSAFIHLCHHTEKRVNQTGLYEDPMTGLPDIIMLVCCSMLKRWLIKMQILLVVYETAMWMLYIFFSKANCTVLLVNLPHHMFSKYVGFLRYIILFRIHLVKGFPIENKQTTTKKGNITEWTVCL